MMLLPTVLSLIAGSCDIITFIGLGGLFTAHITGNLVVLVARVVAGDHAPLSYILSVSVFVAALALTTLFAALLGRAGMASLRPLLILQLLLLSGCFLLCVASGAPIDPTDGIALTAGMLAVSGMAVQNAIVQVSIKGMPSTAVMTTNVSRFVADFIAVLTERNRDLAAKAAAQIDDVGQVHLVNHLGIKLGNDPETILKRVEAGDFRPEDIEDDPHRHCSDHDYQDHVRKIDEETPSRFNADPKRLFESAGSAGKVMILAVRLDTFPKEERTTMFYIGTNNPDELTQIRRHILGTFKNLPLQGEYLHREAFDVAEKYGKDTVLSILYLGTSKLPFVFAMKGKFDAFCSRFSFLPCDPSDWIMYLSTKLFPKYLPKRLCDYRNRFEHHLMLKMADDGIDEARSYLSSIFPSEQGACFECTPKEGEKAFLLRFAAASAAIRYRAIHRREVSDIVALDVALPRNERSWFEHLPDSITSKLIHKLYYGHFFCHVFHQDYVVKKGFDPMEVEHEMWRILDQRHAEYPAEHNVGHLYYAKPSLVNHYRSLDPSNSFNPGIGHTSKLAHWK
jgi:uncharacterized membrane protein YoaK (UPF0700 family)/FAD/FMN-containing dehydrogenase